MLLSDLFNILAYGELSNHHMASANDGTILEAKQPQLIHFCNEALTRLHTRFLLKEKSLTLALVESLTTYRLSPEYSVTGFDILVVDAPYIIDSADDPFLGDVIKVLSVVSDVEVSSVDAYPLFNDPNNYWTVNTPRSLNDPSNYWTVNTPTYKTLQVPAPRVDEVLTIIYQAKHVPLTDVDEEIQLPDTLHGALTAFIAYKVYLNMNTPESQAIAQGHLMMYESVCNEAVVADALNLSSSVINTRFNLGGWK